jgi:hypothetical protein
MNSLDYHDGIVNHDPDGQYQREQVSRLIVNPNTFRKKKVPTMQPGPNWPELMWP